MSNQLTLHELTGKFLELQQEIATGEIDESRVSYLLNQISSDIKDKGKSIACVVQNISSLIDQIKLAEEKMYKRRKTLEHNIESLKRYLKHNMEAVGITKIESPYCVIAIRNNPPSVDVYDESLIPDEYMIQPETPPKKPNKKLIMEDLKHGVVIDGVRINETRRIDIK